MPIGLMIQKERNYKLHYLGKDVFKACSELEQVSYTLENETFITGIGNMFRLLRRHFAELIMVWLQKDVMY